MSQKLGMCWQMLAYKTFSHIWSILNSIHSYSSFDTPELFSPFYRGRDWGLGTLNNWQRKYCSEMAEQKFRLGSQSSIDCICYPYKSTLHNNNVCECFNQRGKNVMSLDGYPSNVNNVKPVWYESFWS